MPFTTWSFEIQNFYFKNYWYVFFFSIWFFFHNHSRITGLQMKGEGISLTPHYYFHTLHSHLDISREITAESLPLHIGSSHSKREPLISKHKSLTTKLRVIKFLTSNLYHQSLGPCQACMIPTSIYIFTCTDTLEKGVKYIQS